MRVFCFQIKFGYTIHMNHFEKMTPEDNHELFESDYQKESYEKKGLIKELIHKAEKIIPGAERVYEYIEGTLKVLSIVLLLGVGRIEAQENKEKTQEIEKKFSLEHLLHASVSTLHDDLKKHFLEGDRVSDKKIPTTTWRITSEKKNDEEKIKKEVDGLLPGEGEVLQNITLEAKTDWVEREVQTNQSAEKSQNAFETQGIFTSETNIYREDQESFENTGKHVRASAIGTTPQQAVASALEKITNEISVEVFNATGSSTSDQNDHEKTSMIKNHTRVSGTKSTHHFAMLRVNHISEKKDRNTIWFEVELEGELAGHKN